MRGEHTRLACSARRPGGQFPSEKIGGTPILVRGTRALPILYGMTANRIHGVRRAMWIRLVLLVLAMLPAGVGAQLRLDVFPGWDGHGVLHRWLPVTVEISNKGAAISGFLEVRGGSPIPRRLTMTAVEIPTQTTKRLWLYVPMMDHLSELEVRLLDRREKPVAETPAKLFLTSPPTRLVAESMPAGWAKMGLSNRGTAPSRPPWQSTRMLKQHLPDDPVGYDALSALHLGWSDVGDLSAPQRTALLEWLHGGGHLIVSTEDHTFWQRDPFWRGLLPLSVEGLENAPDLAPLEAWLRTARPWMQQDDGETEVEAVPSATVQGAGLTGETVLLLGVMQKGRVVAARGGAPLVVQQRAGRGFLTQLLFHPGREPFRSWTERSDFWLSLLQMPHEYSDTQVFGTPRRTVDGSDGSREKARGKPVRGEVREVRYNEVRHLHSSALENFSAHLLSTHQQRQLPWLLLSALLIGYVAVIGPFDYFWLKKRRKLIWTWVTFPLYVVSTTLIIYSLGYWVNAGESEWKQWSVVDWMPELKRHRTVTVARFFSTRNATYGWRDAAGVASQPRVADPGQGAPSPRDAEIVLTPSGARVHADVPVWTSSSFLGRFSQEAVPVQVRLDQEAGTLTLTNPTREMWRDCRLATSDDHWEALGVLRAGETKTWSLSGKPQRIPEADLDQMVSYYSSYTDQRLEREGVQRLNLEQQIFFLPLSGSVPDQPSLTQRGSSHVGSVAEGVDLSAGWQEGDAVFLAVSDAPADWPWKLEFRPVVQRHLITHRIYFPAKRDEPDLQDREKGPSENPVNPVHPVKE